MYDFEIVTPHKAFQRANQMANGLGLSLIRFCERAKQNPSTVYRWQTNKKTYDVSVYNALIRYYKRAARR